MTVLNVTKLDAAQRQLRTAITLWFTGGDPVSTHALAFAAYEVVHTVSKKRNKYRPDLLFDTDYIKDEYRGDWNKLLKKPAWFFKHADRDPEGEIEFNTEATWGFLLYAILGRELCGSPSSEEESAFLWWLHLHHTEILSEDGRKFLTDRMPIEMIENLKSMPKAAFFQSYKEAREIARRGGQEIPEIRAQVV
jgi:hypothetical protein